MVKKQGGTVGGKAKSTGVPTRDILYSEAAKHAQRAIEVLVEIMQKGDSDSARMAAAKTILAKAIPDLKAVEITGQDSGPLIIKIVEDINNNNNNE